MASRLATVAEVRGLSPELADETLFPESLISTWLTITAHLIGLRTWGDKASDGHRLLAAHAVSPAPFGAFAPTGPLTSEAVGPSSRSFGSSSAMSDEVLGSTHYGRMYLELRGLVIAEHGPPLVANSRLRQ